MAETDPDTVELAAAEVAQEVAQLDVPAAPTRIERPDGQVGIAERMAGARLVEPGELRQRPGDQPLPLGTDGPVIHELVVTDLMNRLELGKRRYGQPLQAFNGRNALRDAYEEVLDLAVYLRQQLEEDAAGPADEVPPPPATVARIVTVKGQPWLWNPDERQWIPLAPGVLDGLPEETRRAVEEHTGPLGPSA